MTIILCRSASHMSSNPKMSKPRPRYARVSEQLQAPNARNAQCFEIFLTETCFYDQNLWKSGNGKENALRPLPARNDIWSWRWLGWQHHIKVICINPVSANFVWVSCSIYIYIYIDLSINLSFSAGELAHYPPLPQNRISPPSTWELAHYPRESLPTIHVHLVLHM